MAKYTGTIQHYNEVTKTWELVSTVEFSEHLGEIHQEWRRNVVNGEGFYRAQFQGLTLFGIDNPEDVEYY